MVLFYYSGLRAFVYIEITSKTLVFFKWLENAVHKKPLGQSSNIFIVFQFPRDAAIWGKCLSYQSRIRKMSNRAGTRADHGTGKKGRIQGCPPVCAPNLKGHILTRFQQEFPSINYLRVGTILPYHSSFLHQVSSQHQVRTFSIFITQ